MRFVQVLKNCAEDNATVSDLSQALDYKIGDLLKTIVIGNFYKLSYNMHEVWHPVMHYQDGLCFTFNPENHETADLDLNSREDVLRFGSLNFNVSTFNNLRVLGQVCAKVYHTKVLGIII